MKKIDIKSALIGMFFTTAVIFSLGAIGKQSQDVLSPQWDEEQQWEFIIPPFKSSPIITAPYGFFNFYDSSIPMNQGKGTPHSILIKKGWEPITTSGGSVLLRKRIK